LPFVAKQLMQRDGVLARWWVSFASLYGRIAAPKVFLDPRPLL
jgi:hypothetical protein